MYHLCIEAIQNNTDFLIQYAEQLQSVIVYSKSAQYKNNISYNAKRKLDFELARFLSTVMSNLMTKKYIGTNYKLSHDLVNVFKCRLY